MINLKSEFYRHTAFNIILAAAFTFSVSAHAQNSEMRSGMSARISDLTETEGMLPERDANKAIKAGYVQLVVQPKDIHKADICPDEVWDALPSEKRKLWKQTETALYDIAFNKNYVWGVNAEVILDTTRTVQIALINIKDPKKAGCQRRIGGKLDSTGPAQVDYESSLIPINTNLNNFSSKIQVDLKSTYLETADPDRIKAFWGGIGGLASLIAAPVGVIMGQLSDQATPIIADQLNVKPEGSSPEFFRAEPGDGKRARKIFVKLDFINLLQPGAVPAATGGVTIALQYRASVFSNTNFYVPVKDSPGQLLQTQIRTQQGDKAIVELLPQNIYNPLRYEASNPDQFKLGCGTLNSELRKLGLSPTDAMIFVWATASANTQLSTQLYNIECLNTVEARAELAKVSILVPTKPEPPKIPTRLASIDEMKAAMGNLATMIRNSGVNPDLLNRFTPQMYLVTDDHSGQLMKLDEYGKERTRQDVLALISSKFARLGCYAPRDSRPDKLLPMRPNYGPLGEKERAAAALIFFPGEGGQAGEPLIASFRFTAAEVSASGELIQPPRISVISITKRGTDNGEVVQELLVGRTNCDEDWMKPVFTPAATGASPVP